MAAAATLADQAGALVRRARAGDQNAAATIARTAAVAQKEPQGRAAKALALVKAYIDQNPAKDFTLGAEPAVIAYTPEKEQPITAPSPDPELAKPPLPRGALDKLFDPDLFAVTVLRACGYRHGLDAAAVVLATGPLLTTGAVKFLGMSNFGSEEATNIFYHGVKFSGEAAWKEVAPHLDPASRRCLAIGQCVGRARRIQALRMPNSRISDYSRVAGWELGE